MLFICVLFCVLFIQYFCNQFAHRNPEDLAMIQDLEQRLENLKESNDRLEKLVEQKVQEIVNFNHMRTECEATINYLSDRIWTYQDKEQYYIDFIENLQISVSNAYAQMTN